MTIWLYLCPECESPAIWPTDRADDAHIDEHSQSVAMQCDDCGATFTNQTADRYNMDTDFWAAGEAVLRHEGKTLADMMRELRGA